MFDFIFRRNNPTNAWERRPNLNLSADLSTPAFGGVTVGSPFEQLSYLGRSDNAEVERIDYLDLGILFDREPDGTFSGYTLFFSDEFFKPYVGTITIAGISVAAKDIPGALGEAYWVDTDEDEKTHFYEFGTHEILCMFALDGSINEIVLTTFPVLADPVQRERYGVTKAWP